MASKVGEHSENQTVDSFLLFLSSRANGNPLLSPIASTIDGRIAKIKETYSQCMNETIDKVDKSLQKQLQELQKLTDDALTNSQTMANAIPLANLRPQVHDWAPQTLTIDCQKYWHKNVYIPEKIYSEMSKEFTDLKNKPNALGLLFEKDKARIRSKEIKESFIKIKIFGNFPHSSRTNCKHTLTLKSKSLDILKVCMDKLNQDRKSSISPLSIEINPAEVTIEMLSFLISDYYLQPGTNTFTLSCPLPQSAIGGYLSKQEKDTFIFEVNIETGYENVEKNEIDKELEEQRNLNKAIAQQIELAKKLPNCVLQ